MRKCIYCRKKKPISEFSLEHIIPQFLGGSQTPDEFKTNDVCQVCNNNLGLFVDAAFQKDFLVYEHLNDCAYSFFNPDKPFGLPLRCMGRSDLTPPGMNKDEICECWIGPLGEQIYWVRPHDDRLYWYSGGNPRTAKTASSRAYFMFSERSPKNLQLSWCSFKEAFAGYKVKKIMCTTIKVEGGSIADIGFCDPDKLDVLRINYFQDCCCESQTRKNQISMYLNYDLRFMAKLAIGLSHTILGEALDGGIYAEELYKALWFKNGDEGPRVQFQGAMTETPLVLKENFGVDHGVVLTMMPTRAGVVINLNLSRKMNWTIVCAQLQDVSPERLADLGNGTCLILFKWLNRCVQLDQMELVAHNLKVAPHPELVEIENLAGQHQDYFKNL